MEKGYKEILGDSHRSGPTTNTTQYTQNTNSGYYMNLKEQLKEHGRRINKLEREFEVKKETNGVADENLKGGQKALWNKIDQVEQGLSEDIKELRNQMPSKWVMYVNTVVFAGLMIFIFGELIKKSFLP